MRLAMLLLATAAALAHAGSTADLLEAGHQAMRAKDYRAAAARFEEATRVQPDSAEAWFELGIARSRLENREGAIEAYQRATALDPRNAKAFLNLGNVHFRLGNAEEAAQAYAHALEIDPNYLLAAFHSGWVLRQLNRPEEAERAFQRCLAIPADGRRGQKAHADCTFGLGSILHRRGDYESSAKMMEQVIAVFPQHAEAHYYLGMAYRQLGRMDEAKAQLSIHGRLLQQMNRDAPIESPVEP